MTDIPIHWDLLPTQDVGFTFVGSPGYQAKSSFDTVTSNPYMIINDNTASNDKSE